MNQANLKMLKLLTGIKITLILNGTNLTMMVAHLLLVTSLNSRRNLEKNGPKASKCLEINFLEPFQD
jgi:hypothetical protein